METQAASVHSAASVPRLRVTRRTTFPATHIDGESGPMVSRPPDLNHPISYPDSQTGSEDEFGMLEYAGAVPRLLSASLPPDNSTHSSGTAHRLRALLNRFDTPSHTPAAASHIVMLPSPSEPESDFDLPPAQAARASIKDLFQNALREPGDTPQKPKPTRRASFNAMGTPKVSKARRKSTSDEETDILSNRIDERRSDLSTAASLDRLRLQLTESMPSVQEMSSVAPVSHPPSEATVSTLKKAAFSHLPRPSRNTNSHPPVDRVKYHHDLEPFVVENTDEDSILHLPQHNKRQLSHNPQGLADKVTQSPSHVPHGNGQTYTTRIGRTPHGSSRTNSFNHDVDHRENSHGNQHQTILNSERDRDHSHSPSPVRVRTTSSGHFHSPVAKSTGRVSPGAWPIPPLPGTGTRTPMDSMTNWDDEGPDRPLENGRASRHTSASSNADYRERLTEAELEYRHELERNWNRHHPQRSPPTQLYDEKRSHSQVRTPHLEISLGDSRQHSHSRSPSRLGDPHSRSTSPSSSMSSRSYHNEVLDEQHELQHERERNWNAPHPRWGQHTHHAHRHPALDQEHEVDAGRSRAGSLSSSSIPVAGHPPSHSRRHDDFRPNSRLSDGRASSRSRSPSSITSSRSQREAGSKEQCSHARDPSHGHDASLHRSPGVSLTDKEREEEWGRHRPGSVSNDRHTLRPISPNSTARQHPSSWSRGVSTHPQISSTSPDSSSDYPARAEADLVRLQRAIAPNFIFPMRHSSSPPLPSLTPPVSSLLTPPKHLSSTDMQTSQFKTSSPPIGLSELENLPYLDDEVKTPVVANGDIIPSTPSLSTMDIPKIPGAFGTSVPPFPGFPVVDSVSQKNESEAQVELKSETRFEQVDATSSQLQINDPVSAPLTPAPPGAYRATPTPAKRKGILKVRFDGGAQTPETLVDGTTPGIAGTTDAVALKTQDCSPPPSLSSEDVPPLDSSPSRRKGLRLVDEYGRERRFTEDGQEIMLDMRRKGPSLSEPSNPPVVDDATMTPRRRAKMRQVDAFGNTLGGNAEVYFKNEPNEENSPSKRKKAVFSRLTQSLGELQDNLAEEEDALTASLPDREHYDHERLMDLATVSKAARLERNKISRKLQLGRNAEGGFSDKVFLARYPTRDLSSETAERLSWWRRKWRLLITVLFLEFMLLYMIYWLAMIHAKHMWLKTHFDPFFPALYLHQSRPSFLSRSSSLPIGWSAFAISGAVRRVGIRRFMVDAGRMLWEEIWSWNSEPWEAWGSPATGPPVPRPWPS